jgi:hypothetical protein
LVSGFFLLLFDPGKVGCFASGNFKWLLSRNANFNIFPTCISGTLWELFKRGIRYFFLSRVAVFEWQDS